MGKKRSFLLILGAAVFLLCGCSQKTTKDLQEIAEDIAQEVEDQAADATDSEDSHVLSVKGGHPVDYPEITFGDAFDDFFGAPTWKYFESEKGEDVVEFTGYCTYQDVEVKARMQFILNEDDTFSSGALSFNDVPQSQIITAAMLEKAFEQYIEKSGVKNDSAEENVAAMELTDYLGDMSTDFCQKSGLVMEGYGAEGWAYAGYDGNLDVSEVRDASGYYITLTSRYLGDRPASILGIMVGDAYDEVEHLIQGTLTYSSGEQEEFQLDNGDCLYVTIDESSKAVSKLMYGHFPAQEPEGQAVACSPRDAAGRYVSGTQTMSLSVPTDEADGYAIGVIEWSDSATGESVQTELYEYSMLIAVCNINGIDYKIIFTEDSATWYDASDTIVRSFIKTESFRA